MVDLGSSSAVVVEEDGERVPSVFVGGGGGLDDGEIDPWVVVSWDVEERRRGVSSSGRTTPNGSALAGTPSWSTLALEPR